MSGIHLPDIGKLGIHIATGIKDKKKVAPSNMAENARLRALATRIDNEKHERTRVLQTEEQKMKRRKQYIDKRRRDIQRSKKEKITLNIDSKKRKNAFPPLIAYCKTSYDRNIEVEKREKEVGQYSNTTHNPTSAVFPIQDDFRCLAKGGNPVNEKRKLSLPPVDTKILERKTKQRKSETNAANTSARNILKQDYEGSSQLNESILRVRSQEKSKQFNVEPWTSPTNTEVEGEIGISPQGEEKDKAEMQLEGTNQHVGEELFNLENSRDVVVDVLNSSANPFNYLLVEAQRRKVLHQNLKDAFSAVKACRYLRTPIREEPETYS